MLILLLLSLGAGRAETNRYGSEPPAWILQEWSAAQEELLTLPDLKADPRRFPASDWSWVQFESEFRMAGQRLKGGTNVVTGEIFICCGDRETVRHEAFHAILWKMGDPRYAIHYPELRRQE